MSTPAVVQNGSTRDRIAGTAAALFADRGFAGVSMRDIADAVGIKAASLYNHFADKEDLYFSALEQGFASRISLIEEALDSHGGPEERLRTTVKALATANHSDTVSSKLLHRELLDGDANRLMRVASSMFAEPFRRMARLFDEISPGCNSSFVTACLSATIVGYYDFSPLFAYLDDTLPVDPELVGEQITNLMLSSLHGGTA